MLYLLLPFLSFIASVKALIFFILYLFSGEAAKRADG